MTQVVYYVAASLDGFIAGPSGELDWLHAFETPGNDYGYAQFLQAGCLHELMLALMPVTLGRGIALFQPAHSLQPLRWECLSSTPQALGVQTLHYKINSA